MQPLRDTVWVLGDWHEPPWVGSATTAQLKLLASALQAQGLVVTVAECPRTWNPSERLFRRHRINEEEGIPILSGGVVAFLALLFLRRPAVVHFFVARAWMLPLFLVSSLLRLKIVYTVHDTVFLRFPAEESFVRRTLRTFLCRSADTLITPSGADAELLRRTYPRATIDLIPNGIVNRIGDPADDVRVPTILFAGGLESTRKGLAFLEEALAQLSCSHTLRICGANPWNAVHSCYVGELPPVQYKDLLRQARLVVVPSRYESFSMAALEALNEGIPVILTNQAGFSRWISEGEGCLKVEYGDVVDLTSKIEKVLTDDAAYASLRRGGLLAAERFSSEKLATRMRAVYRRCGARFIHAERGIPSDLNASSKNARVHMDQQLYGVLRAWQGTGPNANVRRAMMLHVQPEVCRWMRAKHFGDAIEPTRITGQASAHFIWYLLWTLKWIILRPVRRHRPVIVTSLNQERRNARDAFAQTIEWAAATECDVWQSTPIDGASGMFTMHTFCIPLRMIRTRKDEDRVAMRQTCDSLSSALQEELNLALPCVALDEFVGLYLEIERAYMALIGRLADARRLVALVQDAEYGAQQSLLVDLVNAVDRPTITLQHGIQSDTLTWVPFRSRLFCVWGRQECDRVAASSERTMSLQTIAHASGVEPVSRRDPRDLVALLANYDTPLADSFTRSRERIRYTLEEFAHFWRSHRTRTLVVRPHPLDDPRGWEDASWALSSESLRADLQRASAVLIEETSAVVDAVANGLPVVFLANGADRDPFKLEEYGLGVIHHWGEEAGACMRRLDELNTTEERRAAWMQWIHTPKEQADTSLLEVLSHALTSHRRQGGPA